jgi:hypothetical protein
MKREERLKLYRSTLKQIEGKEGAFAIFTNETQGKFIQFATHDGKEGFIADIPDIQLSKEEIARIPKDFEENPQDQWTTYDRDCDLDEAVELTEYFFREVCSLPYDYEVTVKVDKGEIECDLCGKTIRNQNVITPPAIYLDEARKLGLTETKIRKLVEWHISLIKEGDVVPESELGDAIKFTKEEGPIFPILCRQCMKKLRGKKL